MKLLKLYIPLFILILSNLNYNLSAQTICTKIVPVKEEMLSTKERIKVKEEVVKYEIIPEVLELRECTTNKMLVSDAYDKLTQKADGTWCVVSIPAVFKEVTDIRIIREGSAPQVIRKVITPAVYEDVIVIKKIKDGKVLVLNAQCD